MMKRYLAGLLSILMIASILGGCGSKAGGNETTIELLEPVGVAVNYAPVFRQDLVSYRLLSGKVVPTVTEVSFKSSQVFESYGVLPGSDVKKGGAVLYASTEDIDKKIEDLNEKIEDSLEAYNESIADLNKDISTKKSDVEYYAQIVQNFEDITDHSTYNNYDSEYAKYKGYLASATAQLQRDEENVKQKSELYALDSANDALNLANLKESRQDVLAVAPVDGRVVTIGYYDPGQYIDKNVPVAAIGDFNDLIVRTDSIYQSEISKALDVYAVVDGERFEVEFLPLTAEEKERLGSKASSYSSFKLVDPEGKVKAGTFVAVIVVNRRAEDALCVPKDAIYRDSSSETYVYKKVGDTTEVAYVKTGLTSGIYTEILSGLEEGDSVLSDFAVKAGTKFGEVEAGKMVGEFNGNGFLFYSKSEWVKTPNEYGTGYIDEVLVKQYEPVSKGQEIAKVHVVSDTLAIERLEREILRANEDLDALVKDNEKDKNAKAIKAKTESIAKLNEKLSDMKADGEIVSVKAPYDGIVTGVTNFEEGDILLKDANIAMVAAEENCFIVVEDENGMLTCGNTAKIEYKDENNMDRVAMGEVVTVSSSVLPDKLTTGFALIKVSPEDMAKLSGANRNYDGWWVRARFDVTVETKVMDNICSVPKSAVLLDGGVTYVKMLDENNIPVYVGFMSAGSDLLNYWILDGISEGMTICLD